MDEAHVVLTENISQRRTPIAMFVSNSSRAWQIWRSLGDADGKSGDKDSVQ